MYRPSGFAVVTAGLGALAAFHLAWNRDTRPATPWPQLEATLGQLPDISGPLQLHSGAWRAALSAAAVQEPSGDAATPQLEAPPPVEAPVAFVPLTATVPVTTGPISTRPAKPKVVQPDLVQDIAAPPPDRDTVESAPDAQPPAEPAPAAAPPPQGRMALAGPQPEPSKPLGASAGNRPAQAAREQAPPPASPPPAAAPKFGPDFFKHAEGDHF